MKYYPTVKPSSQCKLCDKRIRTHPDNVCSICWTMRNDLNGKKYPMPIRYFIPFSDSEIAYISDDPTGLIF